MGRPGSERNNQQEADRGRGHCVKKGLPQLGRLGSPPPHTCRLQLESRGGQSAGGPRPGKYMGSTGPESGDGRACGGAALWGPCRREVLSEGRSHAP